MKKLTIIVAVFAMIFGFGFSSASAAESSIFEAHDRAYLERVVDMTDQKNANVTLREIIVFNKQDAETVMEIILDKGHSINSVSTAKINNHPGKFQYRVIYTK